MYDHRDSHPAYCRPLSTLIDPEDPFLFLRLRENVPSYVNEILSALAEDRCDKFMEIVRDKVPEVPNPRCVVTRPLLLNWAIDHRAIRCAKSLVSLSSIIRSHSYGLLPLHRAATEFLPEFVKLFTGITQLERYPPCHDRRSEYYLMTPLEAALEKLRKKIFWSPTQSVYSLIFGLCGTMEMENACCTIGHLVVASGVQTIIDTIYYYSEGGKIIELAALLYADGISGCRILKGLSDDEYLELRETVATSILSCSKEDNYFSVDGCGVALSFGKKQAMTSILLLLEIFYQTEFSMLGFDTSQEMLGKRMEIAGFDCAADGLQYTGNVLASEVKHHKTMDDQPPPVFFSTNGAPRSTSASHFHEKRGISTATQTFESSKSIVCLPVTGKPEKSEATPEPEYVHRYLYYHVIEEVFFPGLLKDDDVKSYVRKLFTAMRKDKCCRFVKLIKDEMQRATFASFEIAPSLFTWTIFFRAPRCAEAILSGEIGQSVNLNVPPNADHPLPIHEAATRFLPEFVNLFIKYGARLDIPSKQLLPLDACLEKLRRKILWTPAQSVYELVFDLCDNTELEQAYLTISNIMRAMPVKEIQQAICHYVLQQKMVELAVLLYVDAISNLEAFEDLSFRYMALRQFAAANILSRSEELLYFLVDGNGLTVSKDKKWVMKSMMLLFEIFRRTDFSMLGFNSGRIDLQNRIRDAGFDLIDLQNPATGVGKYPEAGEYPEEVGKYSEAVSKYPEVVRQLEPMADLPRDIITPAIWTSWPKRIQISHQRSVFANSARGVSSAAQTFLASQIFKFKHVPMPFTLVDGKACATKATNEQPRLFGSSLKMCSVLVAAIRKAMRV